MLYTRVTLFVMPCGKVFRDDMRSTRRSIFSTTYARMLGATDVAQPDRTRHRNRSATSRLSPGGLALALHLARQLSVSLALRPQAGRRIGRTALLGARRARVLAR